MEKGLLRSLFQVGSFVTENKSVLMGRQKTYLSGANILGFQATILLQLLLLAKGLSFNLMFYT